MFDNDELKRDAFNLYKKPHKKQRVKLKKKLKKF